MEKRLLLFFALTFLIVSLWYRVFPPDVPREVVGPSPAVASETTEMDLAAGEAPSEVSSSGSDARPGDEMREVSAKAEENFVVETDVLRLEFSNRGGRLVSARLRDYEDSEGEPHELVAIEAAEQSQLFPLDVRVDDPRRTESARRGLYRFEGSRRIELRGGESADVSFEWADGSGFSVRKAVRVFGNRYDVDVVVSVADRGEQLPKEVLYGPGLGRKENQSRYMDVEKGVVASRGEVALFAAADVEEGEGRGVSVSAVGVASHYFAALMLPNDDGLYGSRLEKMNVAFGEEGKERTVISAALEAPRGPASFRLFLGPKKLELLEGMRPGLSGIIEFGWMRYPALLLRTALMKIYELVGNYGWAIVLLTVVINVALVPLKHYSFVSMRRMQKLAPQIQRIRDRYRKVKPTDPRYQQMNQEIMGLYKEHKVNPISGCLPMVLMIPFFFAFYGLLRVSIELRQAPFGGWIQDLSVHDPFFVLPILMGVSQVAIQKMTPQTTADPLQAKIMSFMPIMFTFILAWAPAGLVLYWFSNNVVSMGQQVLTNRYLQTRESGEEGPQGSRKRRGKKE